MTGLPRSSFYNYISEGLIPSGIHIGARSVAWLQSEIEAVNLARIQGKTDNEVRQLVKELVASRANLGVSKEVAYV